MGTGDPLGIQETISAYPGMRLCASDANAGFLCLEGLFSFFAAKPGFPEVKDSFELRIEVPTDFPFSLPLVYAIDGRVPLDFHRLENSALCLGSPTQQCLFLSSTPNLLGFINAFVVPYLYGVALKERGHPLPYGELSHGRAGLLEDFCSLFNVEGKEIATELVRLTSRPKRKANRSRCPCNYRRRLSQCKLHHSRVNFLRKQLGRHWFRDQYELLRGGTPKHVQAIGAV